MQLDRIYNIPSQRADSYWLCFVTNDEAGNATLCDNLRQTGSDTAEISGNVVITRIERAWEGQWKKIFEQIRGLQLQELKIALIPGLDQPRLEDISLSALTPETLNVMAEHYWLVAHISEKPIECYYQSVVDKQGQPFGYESFARITGANGEVINGMQIIEAGKALNIKHIIDRHLHVEAVRNFCGHALRGTLFINFIPGFIQKADKYLEGLDDAVREHGLPPKRIALEVSNSEDVANSTHLQKVVEHCRMRGYLLSLDNVANLPRALDLIRELKPDFVKLDRKLTPMLMHDTIAPQCRDFIQFAHTKGCMVIAQGIEGEAMRDRFEAIGTDLFQGYLFSKPMPAGLVS